MKIFHTPKHVLHHAKAELHRGEMVPPHEAPHRMELLTAGLNRAGFREFLSPTHQDFSAITAVHSQDYIHFLKMSCR